MGYGLLNIGSLLLGLISWALPIVCLARRHGASNNNWAAFSILSVVACALSLFLQIVYQDYLCYKATGSGIHGNAWAASRFKWCI